MNEIRSQMEDVLQSAFSDDTLKRIKNSVESICTDIQDDIEYRFKTDTAYNLSRYVESMADAAIEAILKGDEDEMRKRLSCKEGWYTGRDGEHSVIHGRLLETGAIKLRKQIVNAHADLIKNERILDLESQVASLVSQVRQLSSKNEELRREYA